MKPWHSTVSIDKKWKLGRLVIGIQMTNGDGWMGRLGGGWTWKIGAMGGPSEVCIELIFFRVSIKLTPKQMKEVSRE